MKRCETKIKLKKNYIGGTKSKLELVKWKKIKFKILRKQNIYWKNKDKETEVNKIKTIKKWKSN
jgi:hypothetical protein